MVTRLSKPIFAAKDGTLFDNLGKATHHDAKSLFAAYIGYDDTRDPSVRSIVVTDVSPETQADP